MWLMTLGNIIMLITNQSRSTVIRRSLPGAVTSIQTLTRIGKLPKRLRFAVLAVAIAILLISPADAQEALVPAQLTSIDRAVNGVLSATGTPSASIAIVRDARIIYEHAYGSGRLTPAKPATTTMRYSIGSISKQFTATAILLLAEQEMLSLDDNVATWLPELTGAADVSVRQILSMTAGYQDYWPQDYVFPDMLKPTTPQKILDRWARIPLDFEPGTKWQYSNTNYTIAGIIVEKASGMRLLEFLQKHVSSAERCFPPFVL